MRVAFTLIGGKDWTGGYNYLLNLVGLLTRHAGDRLTPLLFFGDDVDAAEVAPFEAMAGARVVRSPLLNAARKSESLVRSVVLGVDAPLRRLFVEHRVDAVFENAQFFGRRLGLPAIAWIPDFQHRHFAHLFGRAGYWRRELGFRAQVAAGRRIMLSSADAETDCHRFYPSTRTSTRVVRFAVPPPAAIDRAEARRVADAYRLPPRYFFMPNQFWQHKNHALVIDALALARERGDEIVVVASGKQHDPRDPSHMPALLARMASLRLEPNLQLLGMIPYDHLGALMTASQALLNPSLFEGWSTTVEEAKSLGVPMLLSDIGVHREQAGGRASFFDPKSPASLADALAAHRAQPDAERESAAIEARRDSERRARCFALDFVELVESWV